MAKRFRIEGHPQAQEFQQFADQYFPQALKNEFLDSIEKTGTVSEDLLNKGNFGGKFKTDFLSKLQGFTSALPSSKDARLNYINSIKDEPGATDQELQNKLEAYQGLAGEPGAVISGFDKQVENMKAQLKGAFTSQGFTPSDEGLTRAVKYAITELKSGKYDPQHFAELIGGNPSAWGPEENQGALGIGLGDPRNLRIAKSVGQDLPKVYTNQVQSGEYNDTTSAPADYSTDISRIQGSLADRTRLAGRNQNITDFLTALPGQYDAATKDFLAGERSRGIAAYGDFIPGALNQLNSIGMLDSGQTEDLLSSKAIDIQGLLEAEQFEAESKDSQFYFDAAYNNEIRKGLLASSDQAAAIQSEQNRILTARSNQFRTSQGILDRGLDTELKRSDAERTLASNRASLENRRQTDIINRRGQLLSDLGAAAGTAIGGELNVRSKKPAPEFQTIG